MPRGWCPSSIGGYFTYDRSRIVQHAQMVSFKNFASRALFVAPHARTQMTRDRVKLARLLFANAYHFLDLACQEHMCHRVCIDPTEIEVLHR